MKDINFNPLDYDYKFVGEGKMTVTVGKETRDCETGDIVHFKRVGKGLKLIRIEKPDGNDREQEEIL